MRFALSDDEVCAEEWGAVCAEVCAEVCGEVCGEVCAEMCAEGSCVRYGERPGSTQAGLYAAGGAAARPHGLAVTLQCVRAPTHSWAAGARVKHAAA